MAQPHPTRQRVRTEEALIVLFCLLDDAYAALNPKEQRYESLKRLSDSEVLTLALLQQLRGVESERSFLRDVARFFSHLSRSGLRFPRGRSRRYARSPLRARHPHRVEVRRAAWSQVG